MTDFYEELSEGDIHIRDKFQFELKSEYSPLPTLGKNTYSLDFYFFVPLALQINKETYTKQQFYYDQTNFIRLKTPGLSLKELGEPAGNQATLGHIRALYESGEAVDEDRAVEDMKLYANIVRSAVRNRVRLLLEELRRLSDPTLLAGMAQEILQFCQEMQQMRKGYLEWQDELSSRWQQGRMYEYSQYIDEFISNISERYSAGLLQELASRNSAELASARKALVGLISSEVEHRKQRRERSPFAEDPEKKMEYAVYRGGLLKKFVFQALFLSLHRKEPMKTFQQAAAAFAAGLAMAFYLYFLSFHSVNPVLDSTAFIVISVLLYVLKDRLKEGLKNFSSKLASGWFSDYRTLICTPNGEMTLGYLKERFSFLKPEQIPKEILNIRNTQFHTELERARRLESVFCFSKEVVLFPQLAEQGGHYYELNDIFRYNISRFLLKASDPYKEQLVYDQESEQVMAVKGPKVYHINIIIRKRWLNQKREEQVEYKKCRIVLDKDGIKRIEKV